MPPGGNTKSGLTLVTGLLTPFPFIDLGGNGLELSAGPAPIELPLPTCWAGYTFKLETFFIFFSET
jgi:hypothetical protein